MCIRDSLDRVHGLGEFLELEVVLGDGQSEAQGRAIAQSLLEALGVEAGALVSGAYLDLLGRSGAAAASP